MRKQTALFYISQRYIVITPLHGTLYFIQHYMETQKTSSLAKSAVGIVAVALIAVTGLYLSKNKKETPSEAVATTPTQTSGEQVDPKTTAIYHYKNGSYQAVGTYNSPAGGEKVSVSLTINDDTVTAATFTGEATHPASKHWQAEFSKGFTQAVVGKKVDELALTVVNGSSLTPKGFMSALTTIKSEAKI